MRGAARPNLWALAGAAAALLALCAGVALAKDRLTQASAPLLTSAGFWALAFAVIAFAPRLAQRSGLAALALVGAVATADLAIGNEPNESTALPPEKFDVLRADTKNDTIALLRENLAIKRRISVTASNSRRSAFTGRTPASCTASTTISATIQSA